MDNTNCPLLHLLQRLTIRFLELSDYQIIRQINQLFNQLAGERLVEVDRVPVGFVHVPGGSDLLGVALAEFESVLGIAFEADAVGVLEWHEGKHLAHDFEDERLFVKGKALSRTGFAQTVFADFFYVHSGVDCGRAIYDYLRGKA